MRDQWAAFLEWWTNRPVGLRRWTKVTRTRAVAAGVFLIGVPAFFAVFPSWSSWSVLVRSAILVTWVVVALGAVAASLDADEIVKRLSRAHAEEESRLRDSAVSRTGAQPPSVREGSSDLGTYRLSGRPGGLLGDC